MDVPNDAALLTCHLPDTRTPAIGANKLEPNPRDYLEGPSASTGYVHAHGYVVSESGHSKGSLCDNIAKHPRQYVAKNECPYSLTGEKWGARR